MPNPQTSANASLAVAYDLDRTWVADPGTVRFDDLNGGPPEGRRCGTSRLTDGFGDGRIDHQWPAPRPIPAAR